jgi:hypothetical protein
MSVRIAKIAANKEIFMNDMAFLMTLFVVKGGYPKRIISNWSYCAYPDNAKAKCEWRKMKIRPKAKTKSIYVEIRRSRERTALDTGHVLEENLNQHESSIALRSELY